MGDEATLACSEPGSKLRVEQPQESPPAKGCENPDCGNNIADGPDRSRRKFCSQSCAAKVRNRRVKRTRWAKRKECAGCGKELPPGHRAKYCTEDCGVAELGRRVSRLAWFKDWLANRVPASQQNGLLKQTARTYLLEEASYKCTRCGWGEPNPLTGKPILTVDHKDGDWSNNYYSNLVVLCYNCHTLTETFGSLNSGRYKRNRADMPTARRRDRPRQQSRQTE